jgi:hypothetical protein
MPVGSTSQRSVQVLGFDDFGRLTPLHRLIRFLFVRPAFCLGLPSDSQSPATPLPLANTSPCRVCRGLSPPSRSTHHHSESNSASHGATRRAWRTKKTAPEGAVLVAGACYLPCQRFRTRVALVPPKPKLLLITVLMVASSRVLVRIGMSATSGSSSSMLAEPAMKLPSIISMQ